MSQPSRMSCTGGGADAGIVGAASVLGLPRRGQKFQPEVVDVTMPPMIGGQRLEDVTKSVTSCRRACPAVSNSVNAGQAGRSGLRSHTLTRSGCNVSSTIRANSVASTLTSVSSRAVSANCASTCCASSIRRSPHCSSPYLSPPNAGRSSLSHYLSSRGAARCDLEKRLGSIYYTTLAHQRNPNKFQ